MSRETMLTCIMEALEKADSRELSCIWFFVRSITRGEEEAAQ